MAFGPPISTVYVQNLEERVKKEPLIEALRSVFSEFGNVVDVIVKTNLKAKGQAFIVFDNAESARDAVDEVQGFELFDKPMRVALARTRSDKTVALNCTEEELEAHKRHRQAEKEKRKAIESAEAQSQRNKRPSGATSDARISKVARPSGLKSTSAATSAVVPDEYLPPNKILFVQNLPEDYDTNALTSIFNRFEGFREIRLVPGRRGIAFVEYETDQGAIAAKENTAGMTLGDVTMKVTYQRQ